MKVIILGTGCPNCRSLEKMVHDAVSDLGLDAQIEKEQDIVKIMNYGIMRTPGLVVNGKVVMSGRLPSPREVRELLYNHKESTP